MARHGENIRKRCDGRWEARYLVRTDTRAYYRSVYGHSYDEAKERREKAMRAGIRQQKGVVYLSFGQAFDEWFAAVSREKKLSTVNKYRQVYDCHLAESLGACPLGANGMQDAITACFQEDLSISIQKSIRCVIRQVLQFIHRQYGMDLPMIDFPEMKTERVMARPLSRHEQAVIISQIVSLSNRYTAAILFGLYTGCRLGEICGLRWEDIDFKHNEFRIRRTVQRIRQLSDCNKKTMLAELTPKSIMSGRIIPLTDEVKGLLFGIDNTHAYVFGKDRPLEPRTLQQHFHNLLQTAGLPTHNFHILRHTFATNCVESGMDVKTLSELLGHTDIKITLERYVHPSMESKRKQMLAFQMFCGQVHGQDDEGNPVESELTYAVID